MSKNKAPKSGGRKALIAVLAIILVAAVAFLCYYFLAPTYTVSFDDQTGTIVNQEVKWLQRAKSPETPVVANREFLGWVTDDGETYKFSKLVTKDFTLKATYDYFYNVNFEVNDAIVKGYTVKDGEKVPKPEDPVLDGYRFDGWFDDEGEHDFDKPIHKDVLIVAEFTKIHTINFRIGKNIVATQYVPDGGKIEAFSNPMPSEDPQITEPDKYAFDGWYGADDGVLHNVEEMEMHNDWTFEARFKKLALVEDIKFSESSYTIEVGSSITPIVIITPEDATDYNLKFYTYTGTMNICLAFQDGHFEGKSEGETYMYVEDTISGKVCKVPVKVVPKAIPVESIAFYYTDPLVFKETSPGNYGGYTTVAMRIYPTDATNKSLTFSSSDTNVCTVDNNGKVTPVGPGKATITATSHNGKTATRTVYVNGSGVVVEFSSDPYLYYDANYKSYAYANVYFVNYQNGTSSRININSSVVWMADNVRPVWRQNPSDSAHKWGFYMNDNITSRTTATGRFRYNAGGNTYYYSPDVFLYMEPVLNYTAVSGMTLSSDGTRYYVSAAKGEQVKIKFNAIVTDFKVITGADRVKGAKITKSGFLTKTYYFSFTNDHVGGSSGGQYIVEFTTRGGQKVQLTFQTSYSH